MRRTTLASLALLALATAGTTSVAVAGDLYGEIKLRDLETGKERPIDRRVPIVIRTRSQTIEATSSADATYYLTVPEDGRWPLTIRYKGMELEAEIGSFYSPNRYDLVLEHLEGEYRLRTEFIREWHQRPQDKDPE